MTLHIQPCLTPPLGGIPFEFLDETYPAKTRVIWLLYCENCMILASAVFDWSTRVTDRQTDRRTDGRVIAYSVLSMLSRAKMGCFVSVCWSVWRRMTDKSIAIPEMSVWDKDGWLVFVVYVDPEIFVFFYILYMWQFKYAGHLQFLCHANSLHNDDSSLQLVWLWLLTSVCIIFSTCEEVLHYLTAFWLHVYWLVVF